MKTERQTRILTHLKSAALYHFAELNDNLLLVKKVKIFPTFLKNYHSVAVPPKGAALKTREMVGENVGQKIADYFTNIMKTSELASKIDELSIEEMTSLMTQFEGFLNLALYYWTGDNDRNFQFRTVVHFALMEGQGALLFTHKDKPWYFSISEDGLRLGTADDEHVPLFEETINVWALDDFSPDYFKNCADGHGEFKKLLGRIRTVQREICLMTEEWEHRNSLVAMVFNNQRMAAGERPNLEMSKSLEFLGKRLGEVRSCLALWVLKSYAPLQDWISSLRLLPQLPSDIQAEFEGLDCLLLSSLQKIFLPGSISRHMYTLEVLHHLKTWCAARLRFHTDDVATELIFHYLSCGLDKTMPPLFSFLSKKSFEWTLAYDPCTGIKAFSWKIAPSLHAYFTACITLALANKLNPDPINDFWLSSIASVMQIPETFDKHNSEIVPLPSHFAKVFHDAQEAIFRAKIPSEDEEMRSYLQKTFSDYERSLAGGTL